ncbi:MAG: RNA-binding transcriptional accessory protein [Barnesiella sp.]|nr:RNA-binding transcriptional accessory protein [Barnesiella sp.]
MTKAEYISRQVSIAVNMIEATVDLLDSGATIPFISRYRKEMTGGIDEVTIFDIENLSKKYDEIVARKQYVITTIEAAGALTDEMRAAIEASFDPTEIEDIFAPYKPRRRTRAQAAREKGLEPLADAVLSRQRNFSFASGVPAEILKNMTLDEARAGAADIIAERISDMPENRRATRNVIEKYGSVNVTIPLGKGEEAEKYQNYSKFSGKISRLSSHQTLAIMRGVNEGLLKMKIVVDDERLLNTIINRTLRRDANREVADFITEAVLDGYDRLLRPSIENEVLAAAKDKADDAAIRNFASNLRQMLLASPLGSKRILAIDPGFRTGCKVVCLDANGGLLHNDVIYPTAPKLDTKGAARKIANLVESYRIEAISLGNGTASRETERFLKSMTFPRPVEVFVVNEGGASVYSASKIARDEFPEYDVTVRGAVSIGRRLMDPLAELVKIEPKSIGVGQYQHDVNQKKLKESLDTTVEACVNAVGVDLNTASAQLLQYVAGIGASMAANIVDYRAANGDFSRREDILKVPRLGAKVFQQAAGFLRIPGGSNPLDNTAVHPESYHVVKAMAKDAGVDISELVKRPDLVKALDLNRYVTDKTGLPTLNDIVAELEKPGRDPRTRAKTFSFDESISTIDDLLPGMELPGIVNNITDFGAFVDLGVHESGLVHLSQICDKFIKHPSEALTLYQHVRVKVIEVDKRRKRISLSMKGIPQSDL